MKRVSWFAAVAVLSFSLSVASAHAATDPGVTCMVKKQQAAAKKLSAKLKCWATAFKKNLPVNAECLAKAEEKFDDTFAKAEDKGGCLTTSDATAIEAMVDGWLGELLAATSGTKIVFISSLSYDGNLGGLAGADAKCQARAVAAGLGGTFVAWLSDSATDAADRLGASPGGYVRTDGTPVATNAGDLLDGTLAAPIDRTEAGVQVLSGRAWTGTAPNGTACFRGNTANCTLTAPGNDGLVRTACDDWTAAAVMSEAVTGVLATNGTWTLEGDRQCTDSLQLYCVQQ